MDRRAFWRNLAVTTLGFVLLPVSRSAYASRLPSLVGSYEGTDYLGGGGDVPMTLNLTTQRRQVVEGNFVTPSLQGAITGRISRNGRRLEMESQIENLGTLRFSGKIKRNGTVISGSYEGRGSGGALFAWGGFSVSRVPAD